MICKVMLEILKIKAIYDLFEIAELCLSFYYFCKKMAFVSKLSNENKSHHILYHKRNIERSNIKDHSRILINLSPPV